jgi:serine/threonine protein kinase
MNDLSPDPDGSAGDGALSDDARRAVPKAGERIGPYRLERLLGAGTGGRVFEVVHEALGRPAAMKLVAPADGRPASRARFLAEALSLNGIHHPHIVAVTDVVETETHDALVMELLEGESLGAAMARGPLEPEQYLPLLAQVCEALAAAHAAGFIHRDLKPENVFLCARPGRAPFVKLLDFGVATSLGAGAAGTCTKTPGRSRPGRLVGTPAYASPEQASGDPVDHTTDIYAVGVILYELASGRLPFEGWSVGQFLIQHLSAPVPRLPGTVRATALGCALDALVQRCMAKRPGDRVASAAELAATFTTLARGETPAGATVVPRLTPAWPTWPPGRALALLAALGLAGAGLGWVLEGRTDHDVRATAVASAPSPPEPAPPVTPTLVTLDFESTPAGAEVRRANDGELLGVTPFRRAFPRAAEDVAVDLTRQGSEPAHLVISTAADQTVRVTLAQSTKAAPRRRATRGLGVEKTIDPFRR